METNDRLEKGVEKTLAFAGGPNVESLRRAIAHPFLFTMAILEVP